ncbi:hypothetical protein HDU85_001183 [Gaertneriomyces sp. JEL0708]|nr:hypothetical protein HDU85_001183 [Gaertneriomyces sp. JEL0708]
MSSRLSTGKKKGRRRSSVGVRSEVSTARDADPVDESLDAGPSAIPPSTSESPLPSDNIVEPEAADTGLTEENLTRGDGDDVGATVMEGSLGPAPSPTLQVPATVVSAAEDVENSFQVPVHSLLSVLAEDGGAAPVDTTHAELPEGIAGRREGSGTAETETLAPLTPAIDIPGSDDKSRHDILLTTMEAEYSDTLQNVSANDSLQPFRSEYEKIHRSVLRSVSHISRLFNEYSNAYAEYKHNQRMTTEAKENSVQDQTLIRELRSQIAQCEEIVTQSNEREEVAKEDLRQLRNDIANLNATLRQGVGLSVSQEKTLQELFQAKEQATRELDEELEKIVHLRNTIADVSDKIRMADQAKRELERDIYDLREKSAAKKATIDVELRNKERLERDLRELRVVVAVKSQEVRGKQDLVNRATDDISILESQIKSQKMMMEKLLKDQESLSTRTIKLQQDADEQGALTSQLIQENQALSIDLGRKQADLEKNLEEVRKVSKIKEALNKKIAGVEEQRLEAEMERKAIRVKCDDTLAEIDGLKRQTDLHRKTIDDYSRERDLLQENFRKTQGEMNKHAHMMVLCKQTRHNIELEMARYQREALRLEKEIRQLQSEREAYIAEAVKSQTVCVADIQKTKTLELELFDYKKRTMAAETKLKHQQNLYEAVQSDRNLHAKHLVEAQAEIAEMKRKLKIMNFQINGFKEDINAKTQALAAEATENARLAKDIEIINEEIRTLKKQNELGQQYIRTQITEASRLTQFVKEAEMERTRQENALKMLVTERDNLSHQLVSRNAELAQAYDQLRTQQSSLLRSEQHYRDRLRALQELRANISDLKKQHAAWNVDQRSLARIKQTVHHLQCTLLNLQTQEKSLEEQLAYPINVHRWRTLSSRNPKAYTSLLLLHTLQKKLIQKSQQESQKEQDIQAKELLYLHLKGLLAKQVGVEAIEQVREYERVLKEKRAQYRQMGSELEMYRARCRELKYELSGVENGLEDVRREFMRSCKDRGKTMRIRAGRLESLSRDGIAESGKNRDSPQSQQGEESDLHTTRTSTATSHYDRPDSQDQPLGEPFEQNRAFSDASRGSPSQQSPRSSRPTSSRMRGTHRSTTPLSDMSVISGDDDEVVMPTIGLGNAPSDAAIRQGLDQES